MKTLLVLFISGWLVHAAAEPLPILIVSGMKSEADIVTGNGIVNVISAGDAKLLREKLSALDPTQIRAVVSFGVSGGLDPKLQAGDLTIPDWVVSSQASWPTDTAMTSALRSALPKAGGGSLYGSDQMIAVDPASRAEVFKDSGAVACDLESQIVAEYARQKGLPFAVVRAVSDPASFTLPPAARLPLLPDGTPDQNAIKASIQSDPSQLSALMQLQTYMKAATETLTSVQREIGFGSWKFPHRGGSGPTCAHGSC